MYNIRMVISIEDYSFLRAKHHSSCEINQGEDSKIDAITDIPRAFLHLRGAHVSLSVSYFRTGSLLIITYFMNLLIWFTTSASALSQALCWA